MVAVGLPARPAGGWLVRRSFRCAHQVQPQAGQGRRPGRIAAGAGPDVMVVRAWPAAAGPASGRRRRTDRVTVAGRWFSDYAVDVSAGGVAFRQPVFVLSDRLIACA